MRHSTTYAPVEATGPGALAGFELRCAECGIVGRTSLESIARADAYAHFDYATQRDARSMLADGESLFSVARQLGVSKELLRSKGIYR